MTDQTTDAGTGAEPGTDSRSVLGLVQPGAAWDDAARTADRIGARVAVATAPFGAEPAGFGTILRAGQPGGGDA